MVITNDSPLSSVVPLDFIIDKEATPKVTGTEHKINYPKDED